MRIYEILEAVNREKDPVKKVEILQNNDSRGLRYILQAGYDTNVVSVLPEGEPPFTPNKTPDKAMNIDDIADQLPQFFKFGPVHKNIMQRENKFISLLSAVHPRDADVLIRMKDRKIQNRYKGVTKAAVTEFLNDTVKIA